MTLRQKKQKRLLTVAEKHNAKIVALRPAGKPASPGKMLMPPITEFNRGYLKHRENDPL